MEMLVQGKRGVQTCASCHNVSRFGNCTSPQRSGLADEHMLISHPIQGDGFTALEPKLNPLAKESIAMASIALKKGAIPGEDYSHATKSIHEHAEDADYLHEWTKLISAYQESKTRRSKR